MYVLYIRRIYDLPCTPNISLAVNTKPITKRIFWQTKSHGINEDPAIGEPSIIIIVFVDDVLERISEITIVSLVQHLVLTMT